MLFPQPEYPLSHDGDLRRDRHKHSRGDRRLRQNNNEEIDHDTLRQCWKLEYDPVCVYRRSAQREHRLGLDSTI